MRRGIEQRTVRSFCRRKPKINIRPHFQSRMGKWPVRSVTYPRVQPCHHRSLLGRSRRCGRPHGSRIHIRLSLSAKASILEAPGAELAAAHQDRYRRR